MLHTEFLPETNELFVSFEGTDTTIFVDKAIYPNGDQIIAIIRDINYRDSSLRNLVLIKGLVWQLRELLRTHLNRFGSRDPDYQELEDHFKQISMANYFLFLGIQVESGNVKALQEYFENPFLGMN